MMLLGILPLPNPNQVILKNVYIIFKKNIVVIIRSRIRAHHKKKSDWLSLSNKISSFSIVFSFSHQSFTMHIHRIKIIITYNKDSH